MKAGILLEETSASVTTTIGRLRNLESDSLVQNMFQTFKRLTLSSETCYSSCDQMGRTHVNRNIATRIKVK